MKKLFRALFVVGTVLSIAACSPSKEDAAGQKDPNQILAFEIGTDFQTAPSTRVVFWNFEPNVTYTKKLVYRAPRLGTFSLSESSFGAVSSCADSATGDYYKINFDYKLKDNRTQQFDVTAVTNKHDQIASVRLNQGDELMVTLLVSGPVPCSTLELYLSAIFK